MSSPCPPPAVITPPPLAGDETPNPVATAVPEGEAVEPLPGEVVTPFYPPPYCLPDTATGPTPGVPAFVPFALVMALAWMALAGRRRRS